MDPLYVRYRNVGNSSGAAAVAHLFRGFSQQKLGRYKGEAFGGLPSKDLPDGMGSKLGRFPSPRK